MSKILTPIASERAERKALAERQTALAQEVTNSYKDMSYNDKMREQLRAITYLALDRQVEEVSVLAAPVNIGPIFDKPLDDLLEEKRRMELW